MIRIDIEDSEVIKRDKRDRSGVYYQQVGWAYTETRDGPNRHPEKLFIFVPQDNGNPKPFPMGKYKLASTSLRVRNNQLEIGFINLEPLDKAAKVA